MEQRSTRKRNIAMTVLVIVAMLLGLAQPASARSVKITGGNGSHAHPYTFNVVENHKSVVIGQVTRIYRTSTYDHFVITEQAVMTSKTTGGFFGFTTKSTLGIHHLYGCYGDSFDVPVPCQRVLFYPNNYFKGKDHLGTPINCTATRKHPCRTTAWTKMSTIRWNISGGPHSDNYPFPLWQPHVYGMQVKINGHWIRHESAVYIGWLKGTLRHKGW